MRLHSGYEDRRPRLDMISLMDVMFLILVFFVYSIFSMAVHRGIKVNLPSINGLPERGEPIVVSVTAENLLYLDKRPLTMDVLIPAAVAMWKQTRHPVVISADREAQLGVGIELLGKLKNNGIERVVFQVKGSQ